jgi:isopentenyl diphosphate isomerase/L-lactate dehydrogenase-like FMN-dependent dehydrogenase
MGEIAPRQWGNEHQFQIYLAGMQGQRPTRPIDVEELERQAREKLSPGAYGYIAGGAGGETTMRANRQAFERWSIVPRMLRNVEERDLRVELFGTRFPAPLLLAPIGVQSIAHPEAEMAVARAASSLGVPIVLSTAASNTLEDVAQAMGSTPRWFQLYWGREPDLTASFLQRAERAGYSALVVTLDTQILSWRERDLQQTYLPFLQGEGLANYFSDPVFRGLLAQPPEQDPTSAIFQWIRVFVNPRVTWQDLAFLRSHWRGPILLKGILHPQDAEWALEAGMDGIIVSNHGGRQVDGALAALEALPAVVHVVRGRVPVLFDSGIRHGADAFKALALGAKAVLLGRPYMWGLSLAGEDGVRDVLLNFLADFDLTMALSGHATLDTVDSSTIVRVE